MLERILLLFGKYPLDFISDLSSFFPVLIGIINRKHLNKSVKVIVLFFCMYFIGDTYMIWLGLLKKNNLFILNIYPIAGIILLAVTYSPIFNASISQRLLVALTITSLSVCMYFFRVSDISPIELLTYRLYVIIIVLAYFNKILAEMRVKNILVHSLFWISAGLIIYATGTFFVSIFSEFIFNPSLVDDSAFDAYWKLNNVVFLLLVIFASIGIWFSKYERKNLL